MATLMGLMEAVVWDLVERDLIIFARLWSREAKFAKIMRIR